MLLKILLLLHVLGVVVWVGGMFFAHAALRPAVAALPPPERLKLMTDVLGRFFRLVAMAVLFILITGFWMIGEMGGMKASGKYVHWMMLFGLVMAALFFYIRFALYKHLQQAVAAADWLAAGAALGTVRQAVLINLGLGVLTVAVALLRLPA